MSAKAKAPSPVEGAVRFTARSCNRKFSHIGTLPTQGRQRFVPLPPFVAATMISIEGTCPSSCPFKGTEGKPGGCFADAGFTRISMRRMDQSAQGLVPDDLIAEEDRQIRAAFRGGRIPRDSTEGGRDLRLHVGGDVSSPRGAEILAGTALNWRARGGGSVWTYTHRWREIPRFAWGGAISVLASVEKSEDIAKARAEGYPAAIVVDRFPKGAARFELESERILPCPAETRGIPCIECRMCLDRDLLKLGISIGFAIHGPQSEIAKVALAASNTFTGRPRDTRP